MDIIFHAKAMAFYGLKALSLIELLRQRQSQGEPWLWAKSRRLQGAALRHPNLRWEMWEWGPTWEWEVFCFANLRRCETSSGHCSLRNAPGETQFGFAPSFPNDVRGLRACVPAHHHFTRNGVAYQKKYSTILEKKFHVFKPMRRSFSSTSSRHFLSIDIIV